MNEELGLVSYLLYASCVFCFFKIKEFFALIFRRFGHSFFSLSLACVLCVVYVVAVVSLHF